MIYYRLLYTRIFQVLYAIKLLIDNWLKLYTVANFLQIDILPTSISYFFYYSKNNKNKSIGCQHCFHDASWNNLQMQEFKTDDKF